MSRGKSAFAVMNNSEDEDETDFITYTKDPASEMEDEESNSIEIDSRATSEPIALQFGIDEPSIPQQQSLNLPTNSHKSTIHPTINFSKFKLTSHNTVYRKDYVIIGLKSNEYLLIQGQYRLIVQRGAIQIDSVTFHANPDREIPILAIPLTSLPVISPTQVTDMDSKIDEQTEENEHLFSPDYKSVVKIINNNNGLQKIADFYPQFKNAFASGSIADKDESFSNYSFCPVFEQEYNSFSGNYVSKSWKLSLDNLVNEYQSQMYDDNADSENLGSQMRVMIIGSKNSGKSTFLRILLNRLISKSEAFQDERTTYVLDIDPGQPEYSPPDCISLSAFQEPLFGFNIPSNSSMSADPYEDLTNERYKIVQACYVGFTSPQREPLRYMRYISRLNDLERVIQGYQDKKSCVLLNAPGWVKGYGIEIMTEVSQIFKPTHLVYLNSPSIEDSENELLNRLAFGSLSKIQGIYINNEDFNLIRYSPSQIRNFKTLSFFHRKPGTQIKYDFTPLINRSPLRISYMDDFPADSESAVSEKFKMPLLGATILSSDNLSHEDLHNCLEAQIVALFAVELQEYMNIANSGRHRYLSSTRENCLNLISDEIIDQDFSKFLGLGLVHSIDSQQKYVNIYTPIDVNLLRDMTTGANGGEEHRFVLVKGRTDIPVEELAPKFIYPKYEITRKVDVEGTKKKKKVVEINLPYVTFSSNKGKGGKAVNVRRNVNRRGLQ